MWSQIAEFFKDLPAQSKVAQLLYERGFQVNTEGKVVSGQIEIPHTQIANEVRVDRRAVDSTVKTILSHPQLKRIYMNLKQVSSLQDVAREFNFGVIMYIPQNASKPGIITSIAKAVSDRGLSIRQVITEDPSTSAQAKLFLITEGEVPSELIEELRKIPGTRSVTVY